MAAYSRTILTSTMVTKQAEFGPDLVNKGDLIEMLKVTRSLLIKMVFVPLGSWRHVSAANSISIYCRVGF